MDTRLITANAEEACNENLIINNMTLAINAQAYKEVHNAYMERVVSYIKKPGMMGDLMEIPSLKFHNVRGRVIITSRDTGATISLV
jgi:hypothetical protein